MQFEEIIKSINEHLKKSSRPFYSDFYVGITEDVKKRLFRDHQVNEKTDWWIYCHADTEDIARDVESYYLEKGMSGGNGGGKGKGETKYIYCYEINEHTKERNE